MGTSHADGLARRVAQGHAAGQNPTVAAILVAESVLQFESGSLAGQVGPVGCQGTLPVGGVQQSLPGGEMVFQFLVGIAQHALPAG